MKTVIVLLIIALTGCQAMPTMKYCDKVEYIREGAKINIKAECMAPIGISTADLTPPGM